MKYIKTKDGNVYEYANVTASQLVGTTIIKTADNVDELCDRIIIKPRRRGGRYKIITKRKFGNYSMSFVKCYWNCTYGATWTDQGLVYVAKMNEEGDFELL